MSATDTALKVIEWAILSPLKPPPQGDLQAVEQLADPSPALCQAVRQLVAITGAKLKLSTPPFGDRTSLNASSGILAAAIGIAKIPELARILFQAIPAVTRPINWVAHHAIVAPALSFLPSELTEELKLLSPLTALLTQPVMNQTQQPFAVAQQMLHHSAERNLLVQTLAQPTQDIGIRRWRTDFLDRWRNSFNPIEQSFVLDVYEAMMIHHEQEILHQVKAAYVVMTTPAAAKDEHRLQEALSIARWWEPLWAIERTHPDDLRSRRYLGYRYREGLALLGLSRKLTGGGR